MLSAERLLAVVFRDVGSDLIWHACGRVHQDEIMRDRSVRHFTRKYRALRVALRPGNRILRWQLRHRVAPRAFALLETTGRSSGMPRQTCVGNGLADDTFWLIAAHGDQADWVRNIRHDPRVRVLVAGRWRTGTAAILPDDDTDNRSRTLPYRWDAAVGRAIATTPLTVRIDLAPPDAT
jgi:deazaflavin-dependent oxidoreductase (nitroreductase family)